MIAGDPSLIIYAAVRQLGNKTIVTNGNNINVKTYEFVSVNVDGGSTPTSEEKTVTPTKEVQVVLPSSNVDYLSKVTVNAIPENYIEFMNHWLVLLGRYICKAKNPDCQNCPLNKLCKNTKNHQ